jgi:gluconate 2-dehydrogenase alpha chain
MNPFMSAGGSNVTIDDFNVNWNFDRGPHGFVGGYNVASGFNTPLPIGYRPAARHAPIGKAWKAATWRTDLPDFRTAQPILGAHSARPMTR